MAPYLRRFHKYQAADPELAKRMMMDWVDEEAQGFDGPVPASFMEELGPFVIAHRHHVLTRALRLKNDPCAQRTRHGYKVLGIWDSAYSATLSQDTSREFSRIPCPSTLIKEIEHLQHRITIPDLSPTGQIYTPSRNRPWTRLFSKSSQMARSPRPGST